MPGASPGGETAALHSPGLPLNTPLNPLLGGPGPEAGMPVLAVYEAWTRLRPLRRIRLQGWSGVYSGRLVYEALNSSGVTIDTGGLFRVSPIYPAQGTSPVGGALLPGQVYRFRAVFWGSPESLDARQLAVAFTAGLPAAAAGLEIESVEVNEKRLEAPEPTMGEDSDSEGEAVVAVFELHHGPAFYRMHGAVISYPSPWRLVASIARRLGLAMGVDLRPLSRRLQPCLELYRDNTRRVRILLSHGAQPTVFHGEAAYIAVCSPRLLEALSRLLEASLLLGAGASPGLGLGEVHRVKRGRPRHQLPPRLQPWDEQADQTG